MKAAAAKGVEKKTKTVEVSKESSKEKLLDPIAEKLCMQRYNIETFHSYIYLLLLLVPRDESLPEAGNAEAHFIKGVKQYFALDQLKRTQTSKVLSQGQP